MKNILIAILILLATIFQAEAKTCNVVVGQPTGAAPSCSVDTNEVGDRTQESTDRTMTDNYLYLFASTADCTGNLKVPYVYYNGTSAYTMRLCLYSKSDTTPQEADALICDSGDIVTDSSAGWKTGTTCASGSVTNTTGYWIGWQMKSDWTAKRKNTVDLYYAASNVNMCPATLAGLSFSTSAGQGPLSSYFQIGD